MIAAPSRLTYVRDVERGADCRRRAVYRCECGKEIEARVYHVASGATRSCGCLLTEIARRLAHQNLVPRRTKRFATRKEYLATWRQERRGRIREQSRAWKRRHPEKVVADTMRRYHHVRRATPEWAHLGAILAFYRWAQRRAKDTGIQHHVDHIVPLRNKKVCGLHVPWNLRVVPALVNIRKANKLDARLWAEEVMATV